MENPYKAWAGVPHRTGESTCVNGLIYLHILGRFDLKESRSHFLIESNQRTIKVIDTAIPSKQTFKKRPIYEMIGNR